MSYPAVYNGITLNAGGGAAAVSASAPTPDALPAALPAPQIYTTQQHYTVANSIGGGSDNDVSRGARNCDALMALLVGGGGGGGGEGVGAPRPWSTGLLLTPALLSCSTLDALLCPCVVASRQSHRLSRGRAGCDVPLCLVLCCCSLPLPPLPLCVVWQLRLSLRYRYNVGGWVPAAPDNDDNDDGDGDGTEMGALAAAEEWADGEGGGCEYLSGGAAAAPQGTGKGPADSAPPPPPPAHRPRQQRPRRPAAAAPVWATALAALCDGLLAPALCCWCALAQQTREMAARGEAPGNTLSCCGLCDAEGSRPVVMA